MSTLLVPQDALKRALLFYRAHLDLTALQVQPSVPATYDGKSLLVVIEETGGAGRISRVLDDVRLTFQVMGPAKGDAHRLVSRIYALTELWPELETGVAFVSHVGMPRWYPEPETRRPGYIYTAQFRFWADSVEL